jgi:hypothetical protein
VPCTAMKPPDVGNVLRLKPLLKFVMTFT